LVTAKDCLELPNARIKAFGCLIPSLLGLVWLLDASGAQCSVIPITSIADISGRTIDFEQPGNTVDAILPSFHMLAIPDALITTLIPAVTGNGSAPISDRALFSEGFLIQTTGSPWLQVGLSGVGGAFGESRRLTLSAFDRNGFELGSITRLFDPADSSAAAFNSAAVFLGLGSTTPIYAIALNSDNLNVAWDNLRFNSVPEPHTTSLRRWTSADNYSRGSRQVNLENR
jgi:hypothetical protein